ncbi:hypothetical protein M3Y99_00141700 [Aphelenchoides fujianensis]|nr:hypothetical protein M3Y99_00141700 [Aphelenchoides fujianensis]
MTIAAADSDPYYHCLCGIHVHKGAWIIGILGIVFGVLGTICELVLNHIPMALFDLVMLITAICLVYGNKSLRPNFYWPHLILNTLGMIVGSVLNLVWGIAAIAVVAKSSKTDDKEHLEALAVAWATLFTAVFVVLFALIQFYFIRVVWRARTYMLEVLLPQTTQRVPHFSAATATNPTAVSDIL